METTIAAAINPFAGHHPVTASPPELRAVQRATEVSLREEPYYLERYGERGRLFGGSDGAWLVTLCRGDEPFVRGQVLWLGRVLAARGMPRWLLRRHLEILHDELADELPGDDPRCRVLLGAAGLLRDEQREHLSDADTRALADDFRALADPAWVARLPSMGRILAAAVADEAAGLARAVESVAEWAADPARFPPRWTAAVNATVADARGRARYG